MNVDEVDEFNGACSDCGHELNDEGKCPNENCPDN